MSADLYGWVPNQRGRNPTPTPARTPTPNEWFDWMCKVLDLSKAERKELNCEMEKAALYCSHAIVPARCQKEWIAKPLLDVSKWS